MNDAPYVALKEKFGVDITFKQFFLIEPSLPESSGRRG